MNETKKRVTWRPVDYLMMDYRGVEDYLAKQSRKGLHLERANNTLWRFAKGEPREYRYCVTYFPEASQFAPVSDDQKTYADYCAAVGWEKVCDWFQLQIFRTEQTDPVPLETDESIRLEMVVKSLNKNYLVGAILLTVIGLLMCTMLPLLGDPLENLCKPQLVYGIGIGLMSLLLGLFQGGAYGLWYWQSKRSIEAGGECASAAWTRVVERLLMGAFFVLFAAYLVSLFGVDQARGIYSALYFGGVLLMGALLRQTLRIRRDKGKDMESNILVFIVLDIVMAIGLTVGLVWMAENVLKDLSTQREVPPLTTIADVMGRELQSDPERDLNWPEWSSTPMAEYVQYWQSAHDAENEYYLNYRVYTIKAAFWQDWAEEQFLQESQRFSVLTPIDPTPWGAEQAWRSDDKPDEIYEDYEEHQEEYDQDVSEQLPGYVLIKGNRMLSVYASWELTEDERAVLAEQLLN